MKNSCIVAIDFGTAYSGYAYSLTQEVLRGKRWEQKSGADTPKTPTCVLFDEDQSFVEFGYKARDRYYEISKNTNNYYYFKDFKMQLYKKGIKKDLEISDVNKRRMKALKVFSAALRFLKEDALKTINKESLNLAKQLYDFTWVVTVPAIWDESARQFYERGCCPGSFAQTMMVVESEAASVWCKHLSSKAVSRSERLDVELSAGTQYIVIDCGGGTIDISVHEVLEDGKLKELHKASGNDQGGRNVDRKFTQCLREFFCDGLWEEYEREHPEEVQMFMDDFMWLRQAEHSGVWRLEFSSQFKKMISRKKHSLSKPTAGLIFHGTDQPKKKSCKLEISQDKMESFYHHKSIEYLLLVGGLSSSHILYNHVLKQFSPKLKVVRPLNPQEAVLKGAVTFGRDQSIIKSRKSPYTYGFSKIARFDASKHKPEKRISTSEGQWCRHLFRKMEGVEGPVASCDLILPKTSKGLDQEVKVKIYFGSTTITAVVWTWSPQTDVFAKMDFNAH
ncbi:hypothetical protein WMY93_034325 [Mugilogobius chulae]|uniref:Heat shock 70 kDa protein 12B n=1 Tax=Mugilogobius chulae TaxID=88201 RepID=A0AAW0MJ55_9GOBI